LVIRFCLEFIFPFFDYVQFKPILTLESLSTKFKVRFSFSGGGSPVFHMPPPCSVVIQVSSYPVRKAAEHEHRLNYICL